MSDLPYGAIIGTEWVGGARYWRGQIMYRPTWRMVNVVREPVGGYWPGGDPPLGLFAVLERVDDNSASEPRGKRRRIALQCFEGYDTGWPTYRRRDQRFWSEVSMQRPGMVVA